MQIEPTPSQDERGRPSRRRVARDAPGREPRKSPAPEPTQESWLRRNAAAFVPAIGFLIVLAISLFLRAVIPWLQ